MRIKLISGGTPDTTKTINIDTGEILEKVISVRYTIDTKTNMGLLLLEIVPDEVNIECNEPVIVKAKL